MLASTPAHLQPEVFALVDPQVRTCRGRRYQRPWREQLDTNIFASPPSDRAPGCAWVSPDAVPPSGGTATSSSGVMNSLTVRPGPEARQGRHPPRWKSGSADCGGPRSWGRTAWEAGSGRFRSCGRKLALARGSLPLGSSSLSACASQDTVAVVDAHWWPNRRYVV